MSTFYLLPPRPLVAERFADFLQGWFPGLDWTRLPWADLADTLGTTAAQHADVIVIHREDLPEGEAIEQALICGFGAQAGDEVVEVRTAGVRRWRLSGVAPR